MVDEYPMPTLTFPFPTVISPFETDESYHDEALWYDEYYGFLPEEDRNKLKKHALPQGAAFMSPTENDATRLRPMGRWFMFLTLIDDRCEFHSMSDLVSVRDRVCDIILGEVPRRDEIGFLHMLGRMRVEFQEFMPYLWFERLANSFYEYWTYGVMEESPYKLGHKRGVPPLAPYLLVHEYSIAMRPYGDLVDVTTRAPLSVGTFRHSVISRLRSLICRLMSIQNDLYSLGKEEARPSEVFNIVPVLRNELDCSRSEAIDEAMRMLDGFADEIVALRNNVPDFGDEQQAVQDYFHHMELMVTGLDRWYTSSKSIRYKVPGAFPEPMPSDP
ncbi:hypothetical protein HNR23_004858 [Nocardiopsis mwathae]|uniref:Terpene synthase n=1 Tax=Nocardiopsis mwathae TaxID=1472723 RepID=A0A7X0D7T0_9ACTN|nr:terpene synthase family protein [Nocardiopsis mwathae]MBB6174798.1 hypothetical protein [Nocardiopsis mwathae]